MNILERMADEAKKKVKQVQRGVGAAVAEVNPLDGNRTYRTVMDNKPVPVQNKSAFQQLTGQAKSVGTGIGLGGVRSITGIGQGVSGLYDLATPGIGTSRVSKGLDRFAKFTDQTAKDEGVQRAYKVGQPISDALSFAVGGGEIKLGSTIATKLPAVAKAVKFAAPLTKVISKPAVKSINSLASKGAVGRVAATGVKAITTPSNVANIATNTGLDMGAEASKGRDISKQDVALSVGANLGFGVGLPVAAKAFKEGASVAAPAIKKGVNNASIKLKEANAKLSINEAADSEKRLLDKTYANLKQRIANAPLGSHGAIMVNNLLGKADRNRLRYDTVEQSKQKMSIAEKIITKRPGMSMKAVNTNQAIPDGLTPVEPPAQALTAPSGNMPLPPRPVVQVANTPPQTPTRYASKTVPESDYVGDEVSTMTKQNAPAYEKTSEARRYTSSLAGVKELGLDGFSADVDHRLNVPDGRIGHQDVADAQTVAQLLENRNQPGDLNRAADMFDRISSHLTAAGQTIQAASILARKSPASLYYSATRDIKRGGGELTPQLDAQIQKHIADVKARKIDTPEHDLALAQLSRTVLDNVPRGIVDNMIGVWKAGLLSGTRTFTGGVASNVSFGAIKKVSDVPTAIADKAISLFTGERKATMTGKGILSGAAEGTTKGADTFMTGIDLRNKNDKFQQHAGINFKSKFAQKVFGNPANKVFQALSALDQPVYYSALKNSLYDQAKADGINKGLRGRRLTDHMDSVARDAPEDMMQIAVNDAEKSVLGYDTVASKAIQGMHSGIDNVPGISEAGKKLANAVLDVLTPFVKVPSAFISRTVDFTPMGIAKTVFSQVAHGKFDQRALSQAIGEGATGTGIIALGVALAQQDLLSGDYPKNDPAEAQRWKVNKIQPNSVKIGNTWVSFNYLGPVGLLFNAGRNIEKADGEVAYTKAAAALAGLGQGLLGQSFLQGFSGFSDAIQDPERNAKKFVNSQASSLIPSWLNDVATVSDSKQRQADTLKQSVFNRIPKLRQSNPEKIDVFGNTLSSMSTGLNKLSPLKPSDSNTSPVINEVNRIHAVDPNNKDLQVTPTAIGKKLSIEGVEIKLDDKQRYDLQKEVGQATQKRWSELIETPEYKALDDMDKASSLANIRKDSTESTTRAFVRDNNLGQYKKGESSKSAAFSKDTADISSYARQDGQSASGLPKNYAKLDTTVKKFYDTKLAVTDKEEWGNKSVDDNGKDLIRRANQIRVDGMPELPNTNKTAAAYADFVAKRDGEKWSPLREVREKRKLLQASYKSGLSKDEQYILGAGAGYFREAYNAGEIDDTMLNKLVAYDNANIELGGSQGIGKKLRGLLGIAQPPKTGPYGKAGGSNKTSYKSFESPLSMITKYSAAGANIARTASLKR